MKFALELKRKAEPEWRNVYLNYNALKDVLKALGSKAAYAPELNTLDGKSSGVVSLSVPTPAGKDEEQVVSLVTEEDFFTLLDSEITKVEEFTASQVQAMRDRLAVLQKKVNAALKNGRDSSESDLAPLIQEANEVSVTFLKVEKFANLNYKAIYKSLKKHDKLLPRSPPCRKFYMSRLHNRRKSWMRGDYSDVLVCLSRLFGDVRGDQVVQPPPGEQQNFVRSTKKYWVRVEDVSEVKLAILKHLPVFLQKAMKGESDSQMVNSVYLDNAQLELYHGRLDKTPCAIALRLRWYGAVPKVVFVERKTHREAWAGDISVKERFAIKEWQAIPFLGGEYDLEQMEAEMREKGGTTEKAIEEWKELSIQCLQAVASKQLVPKLRTQYMRTAYQIPYDATVRISLDTNLNMINESKPGAHRWYRDPTLPYKEGDITRFPHAVLEVKLQLTDESETPQWISELLQSGMLHEVNKFSKFIHGCAALLPEDVQSMPYWMDDPSMRPSLIASGAMKKGVIAEYPEEQYVGATSLISHLNPFSQPDQGEGSRYEQMRIINAKRASAGAAERQKWYESTHSSQIPASLPRDDSSFFYDDGDACCGGVLATLCNPFGVFGVGPSMNMAGQRIEPKLFFANERTLMHWLSMSVILSGAGAVLLAFGKENSASHMYALAMLPLSILFAFYATWQFIWRAKRIHDRIVDRWDDPYGPLVLGSALALTLSVAWFIKLIDVLDAI